jgi:RHH-type transcriptional regulator, proline utilization regulon repressor / proline dehydrogenase / delta 1-pyrroline-5-carboxylate dehydrogenase
MSQDHYLKEARELLDQTRGTHLTEQEVKHRATDLAAVMQALANRTITHKEKKIQDELARMMQDRQGKAFTMAMTDQCFRSNDSKRIANQLVYLLQTLGIPNYVQGFKHLALKLFKILGEPCAFLFVPLTKMALRAVTATVILPGEAHALRHHMKNRRKEGVRINLNHLGEAILGEEEAKHRLQIYLDDLTKPDVEYISIKISTIYSQIHLLGWEKTLEILSTRLSKLYQAAKAHLFVQQDGTQAPKFVNLDMEEYRDLHLTVALFKKVLSQPDFFHFSAGIVLQAYLPDSFAIQKELTKWAQERVAQGGAPIKIRIVKGANLAMERVEASLREWPQAPYKNKVETDANFKRMVSYGCEPSHAQAVHLGIASHNLFDIAYGLVLREERGLNKEISFEMLEGMAEHMRRVVQQLAKDILLYCPVATKSDFQNAIAYLIRRLDENTGPENFLRHAFEIEPGNAVWESQCQLFKKACDLKDEVADGPRRTQDRRKKPVHLKVDAPFENEADTDFSLEGNRLWAEMIRRKWSNLSIGVLPLVIAGNEISDVEDVGTGHDPAAGDQVLYRYARASWELIDKALVCAKENEESWAHSSLEKRLSLLAKAAEKMREKRADLIGVMVADGGKTILEADPEVSEAIDFAEYYWRSLQEISQFSDVVHTPKGTVLVTPPWNFPISIPAGGILAALVCGNCVLFKPAPEAVLSGWVLVNTLWEAGIPKEVLQFINCVDDPVGSRLISDERVNCIILTGATSTARLFLRLRPSLDLSAETGGKNGMIVTAMSDRDAAVKDVIQSAFGHSGQKCSACSLLVLEAEVYDDPQFKRQLKDAAMSLVCGAPWDFSSKVTPIIRQAGPELYRGLTQLDSGEEWLVEPRQDPNNPQLWTPGVKYGVKEGSFSHQTELFGPVLSVMRARDFAQAIRYVNTTPYGLTSGLHSLDEREHVIWLSEIEAGNCYINRSITGAIVQRQPFGGTKASSFGRGAKAGGPNYLLQFLHHKQKAVPEQRSAVLPAVSALTRIVEQQC